MQDYLEQIAKANEKELEELRIKLLGKNGTITNELKNLHKLEPAQRKTEGEKLNQLKQKIQNTIKQKKTTQSKVKKIFDYTIPSKITIGKKHIISQSIELLKKIFAKEGFNFVIGPDIEDVYYNFHALNIPLDHPARDNNDTFYISENTILRTHTTSVQIRLLEKLKNSTQETIRSYSIGRVYRNDTHDATHACSFHQVEGIVIEKNITLAHLKGFLETLLTQFFEKKAKIRFRPSYFPFTEPSCEVDIMVKKIEDKLIIDPNGFALELGGCGIIEPSILTKFNKENAQAFAFGMGLERLIMIKHNISNLHDLYNNHMPTLNYISQL